MAYYDRKKSGNYNTKTIYTGTVIQKQSLPIGEKIHFYIEYVNADGKQSIIYCDEMCERFDNGDTVFFTEENSYGSGSSKKVYARIWGNHIGKIVTINGSNYIRRNEGSIYTFDGPHLNEGQLVSFFVKQAYDYRNGEFGVAVNVSPKEFPSFLKAGSWHAREGRYTGEIYKPQHVNQRFVEIIVDDKVRKANNLGYKYSYMSNRNEWFFEGDVVSFELKSERDSQGHVDATRLLKIASAKPKKVISTGVADQLNVPDGMFSDKLRETSFLREVFALSGNVKSSVRKIISFVMENDNARGEFNITSENYNKIPLFTAFDNVTATMHRNDADYQYDVLSRIKPFYDAAVPYFYADKLGDSPDPEKLESVLIDVCDYLNSLLRAQRANNALDVEIDKNGVLYPRFAEMIRYYLFKKGLALSDKARLEIALVMTSHSCWSDEDNAKLLANSIWAEAYNNHDRISASALAEKTSDAIAVGKFCDLMRRTFGDGVALDVLSAATDRLGADVIHSFISSERGDNESFLLNCYGQISDKTLVRYIDEICLGNVYSDGCADECDRCDEDLVINSFLRYGLGDWSSTRDVGKLASVIYDRLADSAKAPDCDFDSKLALAAAILYAKCGDMLRARFIYSHLIRHRSLKNNYLFKRIRQLIDRESEIEYSNEVLYYAFKRCSTDTLYDFLIWAAKIFDSPQAANFTCDISDNPNHVKGLAFSYYFAKILYDPEDYHNWNSLSKWFIKSGLSNFKSKFVFCVCQSVLHRKYHLTSALRDVKYHVIPLLRINQKEKEEGLLPFVCEYIPTASDFDHEVEEELLKSLKKDNLSIPQSTDARIEAFIEYCKKQLLELKKPLYADLIVILKYGRLSVEEIRLVTPYASGSEYISRELVNAYENGGSPEVIEALLDSLKKVSKHSSFVADEIHRVWREVIFGDEERAYHFLSKDEFECLRQACFDLLRSYPNVKMMENYLRSDATPYYKLALCSSFVGLYSEREIGKLFKNFVKRFDAQELCKDPELLSAWINCLDRLSLAELHFNTTYENFYKYRRYVKMVISRAILYGGGEIEGRCEDVYDIVKKNNHQSIVDSFGFESFIGCIRELLLELGGFDESHKNHLLLSLITEDMSSYFKLYGDELGRIKIPSLKRLLRHCDFRDIHSAFFADYLDDMRRGDFDEVQKYASILSDELDYVIDYLNTERDIENRERMLNVAKECFVNSVHSLAIVKVMDDSVDITDRYDRRFRINLVIAKQLPSKILGEARRIIVERASSKTDDGLIQAEFALEVVSYLAKNKTKGYYSPEAEACYDYLKCLCDYFTDNVFARDVERIEPSRLPVRWKHEAEKFKRQYANKSFTPDKISNRSFGTAAARLEFPNTIKQTLGLVAEGEHSFRISVYEHIARSHSSIDYEEDELGSIIAIGADWLINVSADHKDYKTVAVAVCKLLHEYEGASAELKLRVWLELYGRYQIDDKDFAYYLNDLSSELTLEDWLKYSEDIYENLNSDFDSAYSCCMDILTRLGVNSLSVEDCSEAQLLLSLENTDFNGYSGEDIYLNSIHKALGIKLTELRSRKITLDYENAYCESDGVWAYFSVRNEGEQILDLGASLKLNGGLLNAEIGLSELRPGWITGFRFRATPGAEISVTVEGPADSSMPLYRDKIVIDPKDSSSLTGGCRLYNENALSDKETLFGRDDILRTIKEDVLVNYGYAVITGPSRVGKTSIINHIKAADGRRDISVFAITESDHYFNHFKGKALSIGSIPEYLFLDTVKYGVGDNDLNRIIDEGLRDKRAIRDIYSDLIDCLAEKDKEIWLIFDEFQQIVNPDDLTVDERDRSRQLSKMDMEDMKDMTDLLRKIREYPKKKIKIIFCGSDRLHKEITRPGSPWRDTFKAGQNNGISNWITVNNIDQPDFEEMLTSDDMPIRYTKNAIEAASSYSSRIPLYGKLICNQAIKDRRSDRVFCYDIAAAVNRLFSDGDVAGIIEPVYKGLGRRDILCLDYLARGLAEGRSGAEIVNELEKKCGETEIRTIFNYARDARLLLNQNVDNPDFSSVFFYKVFSKHEQSRTADDILSELIGGCDVTLDEIAEKIIELDDDQRSALLMRDDVFSTKMLQRFATVNNIDNSKNVHINIEELSLNVTQQMNVLACAADFNSPEAVTAFEKLFGKNGFWSTERYLGPATSEKITHYIESGEELPEALAQNIEQANMKKASAAYAGLSFENIMNLDNERWKTLLRTDDSGVEALRGLKDYAPSLSYALALHDMLTGIYEKAITTEQKNMIDFTPVAILYCKIAEKMLNDTHRRYYESYLSRYLCAQPERQGIYTLGTFSFAINRLPKSYKGDPNDWNRCLQELSRYTGHIIQRWRQHALYSKELTKIRNDTAHRIEPIDYDRFSHLINILFTGDIRRAIRSSSVVASFTERDIVVGNPDASLGELLLICKLGGIKF